MEILLISGYYPFNYGDVAFIKQEVPFLAEKFDKVHVFAEAYTVDEYERVATPSNVILTPTLSKRKGKRGATKLLFSNLKAMIAFFCAIIYELQDMIKHKKINKNTWRCALNFLLKAFVDSVFVKTYLSQNPNIKIAYTYWYTDRTLTNLLARKLFNLDIKCVTRTHGGDLYEFDQENDYQPFKRWMDKRLDKIYFASNALRNYYFTAYGIKQNDKHILSKLGTENKYNYPVKYKQIIEKDKIIKIVSCSYIIPRKRVNLIIEALNKIGGIYAGSIKIYWTHIGSGAEKETIENLTKQLLDNKTNIEYNFTGFMNNDAIKQFYNENYFDCFVSTTEAEGGNPVSIMEAISFGIPVIATAVGGVPEIVTKEIGVLLNPDPVICVEELIKTLHNLNGMTDLQKRTLRESCRRYWEDNYMAEKQYKIFVTDLLETALQ